jgi:hypothetical protein
MQAAVDERSCVQVTEMKDPKARTIFAGVDGRTDIELPEWYRQRHGGENPVTFAEAIRDLPQAVETTVAYQNPYTDEWIETERFNALIEHKEREARLEESADQEEVEERPDDLPDYVPSKATITIKEINDNRYY